MTSPLLVVLQHIAVNAEHDAEMAHPILCPSILAPGFILIIGYAQSRNAVKVSQSQSAHVFHGETGQRA